MATNFVNITGIVYRSEAQTRKSHFIQTTLPPNAAFFRFIA